MAVNVGSRFVMRSIFAAEDHGGEFTDKEFVLGLADALVEEETGRQRAPNLPPTNPDWEDSPNLTQIHSDLFQKATRIFALLPGVSHSA